MRWLRDVMTYLKLRKLKYASCVRHGPCLHGNVHNKCLCIQVCDNQFFFVYARLCVRAAF